MTKRRRAQSLPDKEKVAPKAVAQGRQSYRTVRPRPLRYDEKVRILWPGDPELEEIDGGAFAQFLRESQQAADFEDDIEQAANPSKRRVSKKIAAGPSRKRPASASSDSVGGTPGPSIEVPRFRLLPKREWPEQPPAPAAAARGSAHKGEAAYIRLRGQTQDELDAKVEYDLDSDDEEWLGHRNKKGGGEQLSKDDLERLISGFEKGKHAMLEVRQSEWKRLPGHKAQGKVDPAVLYPASSAIKDFADSYPSLTVRAVHNYWAKKAAASKLPLLQCFWYDKPWARLVALTGRQAETSSSDDEDAIPFQGKDSPKAAHHRKRTLELEEVHERLHIARLDLERLRTIADQVQRREKIKKRDLVEWRTLWRQKLAVVGTPKAKVAKKVGRPPKAASKATSQPASKAARGADPAAAKKVAAPKAKGPKAAAPAKAPGKAAAKQGATGSIVGGLVSQLRKGQKEQASRRQPQKKAAAEEAKGAAGDEGAAHPASPPLTRRQEQDLIDAAIQVSLLERDGDSASKLASRPASAAKRVKFAELNGFREGRLDRSKGARADATVRPAARKHAAEKGSKRGGRRAAAAAPAEEAAAAPVAKESPAGASDGVEDEGGSAPMGFTMRLGGPGRRKGSLEWLAECPHGTTRLTNIAGLVEFFDEHYKCRLHWKQYARRKREPAAEYAARLATAFPLTRAEASSRGWPVAAAQPSPSQNARRGSAGQRPQGNRELAALMGDGPPQPPANSRPRSRKPLAQGEQQPRDATTKRRPLAEPTGESEEKPPAKRTARGLQRLSSSREQSAVPEDRSMERDLGRRTTRGRDTDKEAGRKGQAGEDAAALVSPTEMPFEDSEESSGSDTFIPADCDPASSDDDDSGRGVSSRRRAFGSRRPPARLARNAKVEVGTSKPRKPLEWGSWRNQDHGDASDESCLSEGSLPSLFSDPEPPKPRALRRWPQRQLHRPAARATTGKNIVAAARQRVKKRGKHA